MQTQKTVVRVNGTSYLAADGSLVAIADAFMFDNQDDALAAFASNTDANIYELVYVYQYAAS